MLRVAGGNVTDAVLHLPRELDRMIAASCVANARSAARESSDRRSILQVLENEEGQQRKLA